MATKTNPDAADPSLDPQAVADAPSAIPEPTVAIGDDGQERPLSGGSFTRVDGKLVRQEA